MNLRKNRARLGRRMSSVRSQKSRLRAFESLEARAMLTATPTGVELTVEDLVGRDYVALESASVDLGANGDAVLVFEGTDGTGNRATRFDRDIYVQRVGADGSALGDLLVANSVTRGEQIDPVVAVADSGEFLVVWSGSGQGDKEGIYGQRFSASGDLLGDQFLINSTGGGKQVQPTVAMAGDGRSVVAWQGPGAGDASGIWMQQLAADGSRVGSEVLVNTTTDGRQTHPDVGMDDSGNFVVAWSSRGQDGDAWGIFAQRFGDSGNRMGDEFAANSTTAGSQHHASVGMSSLGQFAIGWSSLGQDGDSWGVFAQRFDADGVVIGGEFQINEDTAGHQREVDLAMAQAGELFITWADGQSDGNGWEVAGRSYDRDGNAEGLELSINNTDSSEGESGHQTNPSVAVSQSGRSFVSFDATSASMIHSNVNLQAYDVEVGPTENVSPELDRVDNQQSTVGETIQIQLQASDSNLGDQLTFSLEDNPTNAQIVSGTVNGQATFEWTPTNADRNTNPTFRVFVADEAGLEDAEQFSIVIGNVAPTIDLNGSTDGVDSELDLALTDTEIDLLDSQLTLSDGDQTELAGATIQMRLALNSATEDLSIDVSGTNITSNYDSARKLITLTGSGTIAEYTSVLRTLKYTDTGTSRTDSTRSIDIRLDDGTDQSQQATITINVEGEQVAPVLAPIANVTVLAGSPLWIPLNGTDANGDSLSFSATVNDSNLISTRIPTGNRSINMSVDGFGDMVFELFEDLAPRATDRMITLANDGFYEDIIFHRIINDFVIQGGDPTGTGTSGSDLGQFDDQFHVDAQHNRTGLLSMAKTTDDTNNSQFFITEGESRHLDFNHTVFGLLTEGEDVRQAISDVTTDGSSRPLTDVVIDGATIFTDTENGIMMLSAPENASGTTTVTVSVNDGNGGIATQDIIVTVVPDNSNGNPFLDDIPTINASVGVESQITLTGKDVEGDSFRFLDETQINTINASIGQAQPIQLPALKDDAISYSVDPSTGVMRVTASAPGTYEVTVAVAVSNQITGGSPIDFQVVNIIVT